MIDFQTYIVSLRGDVREYVISASEEFRKIGTRSRNSRIKLVKLPLLQGMYKVMENYQQGSTNMYGDSDMLVFIDQINTILGTDYEVSLGSGIWYDDDDGGIWTDGNNGGVWEDIQTT